MHHRLPILVAGSMTRTFAFAATCWPCSRAKQGSNCTGHKEASGLRRETSPLRKAHAGPASIRELSMLEPYGSPHHSPRAVLMCGIVAGVVIGTYGGYLWGHQPVSHLSSQNRVLRVALAGAERNLRQAQVDVDAARAISRQRTAERDKLEQRLTLSTRPQVVVPSKSELAALPYGGETATPAKTSGSNLIDRVLAGERFSTDSSPRPASKAATATLLKVTSTGKFIQFSDGSIWQIAASDWDDVRGWGRGDKLKVRPSKNRTYPFTIINRRAGQAADAKLSSEAE